MSIWFWLTAILFMIVPFVELAISEIRWRRENPRAMEQLAHDEEEQDRKEGR